MVPCQGINQPRGDSAWGPPKVWVRGWDILPVGPIAGNPGLGFSVTRSLPASITIVGRITPRPRMISPDADPENTMLTRRQLLCRTLKGSSLVALGRVTLRTNAFAFDNPDKSHRLLILDIGRENPLVRPGSDHHHLLLVDIESGKILARQKIGTHSSLAVSPKADVVAAIYNNQITAADSADEHLEFFQASDLKRLESGLLPRLLPRMGYQLGAASDSWLSPDGQELLIQGPEYNGQAAHMATSVLNCVKRGRKA